MDSGISRFDDVDNESSGTNNIDSVHGSVKSTAIVKYSAVESPATFELLECNTDLNLPPANWLSSSAESYGLQYVLSSSTEFSSLRMADMFPDCVGEVDVISDAENIKKLLKLPYSRAPVSMLVHRIKATLLIDDFDIHKFLFRSAEINWHALKNFLLENVFHSVENTKKCITHESKRRYALQQENLISKFLYHSIGHLEEKHPEKLKFERSETADRETSNSETPPLPEPNLNGELPENDTDHIFARNVVWTFDDIQMLLGTDMPIFGGGTHPCVSLRLRDLSKPISVLTGIDYWLDNLMCNVPEVAMCYHINGIVQKYELIKTEDLPCMEGSKFSPTLIRDVAQNILAFLKSNATKAGHTYWLLKGKDDDVVKLYDLTSLCSNDMVHSAQNPFTIPVALLLYRVARNMMHSPRIKLPTNPATIRMLLKNCIRLLPKEKYPQIIASAHYMFSDSLIPLNTDPASPKLEDLYEKIFEDRIEKDNCCKNDKNDPEVDVEVKTMCLSKKPMYSGGKAAGNVFNEEEPEIMRSIAKRCKVAIEHIADGLNCLKFFDSVDFTGDRKKESYDEEQLNMAHPRTAIPMPYEPLKNPKEGAVTEKSEFVPKIKKKKMPKNKEDSYTSIGALLCKSHVESMPTWQHPPDVNDNRAWKQHLRTLLYEKACLVYATLAEYEYSTERYGSSLKHIKFVLESRAHLTNGCCENILMSYLLGRAGDCCFQIGRKWDLVEKYKDEYLNVENFDAKMKLIMNQEEVQKYKELDFLPSEITTIDNILNNSWMCYSKALELETRDSERDNLQRRLGNICNELGSYFMKKARETIPDSPDSRKQVEALFAISMTHLENGVKAFKMVKDNANLALLYSNTGRLMRLMAHFYSGDNTLLNKVSKSFYNKALSNYQSALSALSYRRLNPEIWDTVFYELSTTLYTMATLLQDYSPQSSVMNKTELEREVIEYLSKALKYCDMETPGPKQPIYQYRVADIHHRLASLYHNMFRNLDKDSLRRSKILQLCHLHYERAVKLYSDLELPAQYFRALLERIALYEYLSEGSLGNTNKIKSLQCALDLVLQSAPVLKLIFDKNTNNVSPQFTCETISNKYNFSQLNDFDSGDVTEQKVKNNSGGVQRSEICFETENFSVNYEKIQAPVDYSENLGDEDKLDDTLEERRMLELLESRMQYILRVLTKRCSSLSSQPKFSSLAVKYKKMYTSLLNYDKDLRNRLQHLYRVVIENANIHD